MTESLQTLVALNERLFARHCEDLDIEEPEEAREFLCAEPLDDADPARLGEIMGAAIPVEWAAFLQTRDARVNVDAMAEADEDEDEDDETGFYLSTLYWVSNDDLFEVTEKIPELVEEYGWEPIPPVVCLSIESSEVLAYRLADGQVVHIAYGDSGEVTELGMDFGGLIDRWCAKARSVTGDD
ncbi:MAG: hypothetical protein CMN30_30130 [Sandaracinus sp.]|nr:hypothetical protein [Sandaracinus sp.]|tara:strand:+ start:1747 stop:2295 length:549 start_codon:yes stop_codon:yes gene_type:complete